MLPFRTIRQRRHRANKAQVSAVATVLGLLLVVTFISNFLTQQLPELETTAELDHILLVENQMSRLQATILAQANTLAPGLSLSSPVTLGSSAVPPFGGPSPGVIAPESGRVQTLATYSLSHVVPAPPNWGVGSACLTGGSGTCAGNGNLDTWNITNANNTALSIFVTGGSNSLIYKLNGNNDTVTVTWNGKDVGSANFIVNGSNDAVLFKKGGSDTTVPTMNFLFYGQSDTFSFNPAGSSSAPGGMTVYVQFVGTHLGICPYGSLSSSDKTGTLTSGGKNLNLTVVWDNSVGLVNGPHSQTYPGGAGNNETIHWWNRTGVLGCAFTASYSTTYQSVYGAGVAAHLFNRYLPATDVAYDQGAVIESQLGGSPIMISPPQLSYTIIPAGYAASLTLVNVVGNVTAEGGLTTAAVMTQLIQTHTFTVRNGQTSTFLSSPVMLNITTLYPAAWLRYIGTLPQIFPNGARCVPVGTISAPYTCTSPPTGGMATIEAQLDVLQFTLTTISVSMSVR